MELVFRNFVGNPSLVGLLRKAELPPAMIFSGPSGIGKKVLATLLAGLANCRKQADRELCGECVSCVQLKTLSQTFNERNHPDVLIADWPWVQAICRKKKKRPNPLVIPIDAVREMSREAQYRPFQGKKRFFIVDEAEKMSEPAANAFLKTLEEPPETTHIILVTAFPDRLLPTILSRCQHFQFRSLTQTEMTQYLRDTAALEQPELTAAFSEGSIGRALTLDLEATLKSRDLMLGLVEAWIKRPSFEQIFGACEKAPLQRDLKDREKALDYLQHLATVGEDLYRVVLGTPERVVNRDRQELLGELASKISLDWIESFLYHVREACQDVRSYVNALVCFETLWLKTEVENAGSRQGQARDHENGL